MAKKIKEIATKRRSDQGHGSERWMVNKSTIASTPALDEIAALDIDFTPPKVKKAKKRIQPTRVSERGADDEKPATPVSFECEAKSDRAVLKEFKPLEEHDAFYVQGEGWISRHAGEMADGKY